MPAERKFMLCSGDVVAEHELFKHPKMHIVGELRHVENGEMKVVALVRFVVSADTLHVPLLHPLEDGRLIGEAHDVRCRFAGCSNAVNWYPGRAASLVTVRRALSLWPEDVKEIVG